MPSYITEEAIRAELEAEVASVEQCEVEDLATNHAWEWVQLEAEALAYGDDGLTYDYA